MFTRLTFKTNKALGNMEHESVELTYEFDNSMETVEDVYDTVRGKALELLGINESTEEEPPPKAVKKPTSRAKRN